MTIWEDKSLLKLKGTSTRAQNVAHNSQHEESTLSSSLLWRDRYGHINYDSIGMLNNGGVSSFPTIPKNLNQCDVCILGKHSKQPFHDLNSKSCRKLEWIYYDLCGPIHIASTN